MIICIAGQKGGAGKTTVAINLALALAGLSEKVEVALVDADVQRSCMEALGKQTRPNLTLYEIHDNAHETIKALKQRFIIVDTPGRTGETMYQAVAVSDLVIVPIQPSPLDVLAAAKTVKALLAVRAEFNPGLKCCFLINRATPRTTLAGEIRKILKNYYPFPVLATMLHDRQAYKQSLSTGQSVIEFDKTSAAAKEIGLLTVEIKRYIDTKKF